MYGGTLMMASVALLGFLMEHRASLGLHLISGPQSAPPLDYCARTLAGYLTSRRLAESPDGARVWDGQLPGDMVVTEQSHKGKLDVLCQDLDYNFIGGSEPDPCTLAGAIRQSTCRWGVDRHWLPIPGPLRPNSPSAHERALMTGGFVT